MTSGARAVRRPVGNAGARIGDGRGRLSPPAKPGSNPGRPIEKSSRARECAAWTPVEHAMTEISTSQARSIASDYLSASYGRHCYIYFDDATSAHWVVSESDMESLGRALDAGGDDAYSRWCSMAPGTEVDIWRLVREWGIDADTDLDALAHEADDVVDYLAFTFLQDEIAEQVAEDEEIAAECA